MLIFDNQCVCSDESCVSDMPCRRFEAYMGDDGTGSDITIPSFLGQLINFNLFQLIISHTHPIYCVVFKPEGDVIRGQLESGVKVG